MSLTHKKLAATALVVLIVVATVVILRGSQREHVDELAITTRSEPESLPVVEPEGDDAPVVDERPALPLVPPDPIPSEPGTLVLRGRVIDHESELPIEGATIVLEPAVRSTDRSSTTVKTDREGNYRVEGPNDLMRWLRFEVPDRAVFRCGVVEAMDRQGPLRAGDVARLRTIRMRRGVQPVIRVLDEAGRPVAGAELELIDNTTDLIRGSRKIGTTDERGEWTATERLAGTSPSTNVVAVAGDAIGVTPLGLLPEGSRGGVLEVVVMPTIELVVRVLDADEKPMSDVAISATGNTYALESLGWGDTYLGGKPSAKKGWFRAQSGSDGTARIRVPRLVGAFDETYAVHASVARFDRATKKVTPLEASDPIEIRMKPFVEAAKVHAVLGSVLDGEGRPVEGAVVRYGKTSCTPDPLTGRYRLDDLELYPDQLGAIRVEAPGFVLRAVPSALVAKRKVHVGCGYFPVEYEPIPDPVVADFVLDPFTSVRGRVVDADGEPVEGIPVAVEGGSGAQVRSRPDGSFCIALRWERTMPTAGIWVRTNGWRRDDTEYATARVLVDDIRDVRIVLEASRPRAGSLHVRVIDAGTSEPAPVLGVALLERSQESGSFYRFPQDSIVCIEDGFRARGLEAGEWIVRVLSSNNRVAVGKCRITNDATETEIDLLVSPPRSLTVRVLADDSIPAGASNEPFRVHVRPENRVWSDFEALFPGPIRSLTRERRARETPDGSFVVDGLAPGRWTISAYGTPGFAERTVDLTNPGNASVTLQAAERPGYAMLQLTGLDRGFDGSLLVRLERKGQDAEEFVADPALGRAQTFSVRSGTTRIVVYPTHGDKQAAPNAGDVPIKQGTIEIVPGETTVVALFPR